MSLDNHYIITIKIVLMPRLFNQNRITAWGETKSFSSWAEDERCVISAFLLKERIRKGWDPIEALTIPKGLQRPGQRLTARRWTQDTKVDRVDSAIRRVESGRLWLKCFYAANQNLVEAAKIQKKELEKNAK